MTFECRISILGNLVIGDDQISINEMLYDRAMAHPGRVEFATVFENTMGIEIRWDGRPAELWSPNWDFEKTSEGCGLR